MIHMNLEFISMFSWENLFTLVLNSSQSSQTFVLLRIAARFKEVVG